MGGYGETEIHPASLTLTLAMGIAILFLRRDQAIVAFLLVACLVTHAQRIVVSGLDFSMLRIVILFGWARVLSRGETRDYRFQPLDGVLAIWIMFGNLVSVLGPRASMDLFVMRLGFTLDAAGTYFLFRILLRDVRDVYRAVVAFAWMALLMVGPMVAENLTGRNAFAVLGGVPELTIVRDGRLRCQASFSHAILTGIFGASTFALVGALWLGLAKQRLRYGAGLVAAAAITILSNSAGPLMALLTGILGWALWPQRRHMRLIRWGTVAALAVLEAAGEKPLWHLIPRVSRITGGTGYHRYYVIQGSLDHFGEWWLLGTASTSHWKHVHASDITNQYILEGVRGGLGTMLSLVAVLVVGFRTVGRSLRRAQAREDWTARERRRAAILAWGLGVCLAVHSMAFIGVAYFGQLMTIFYLHLALISCLDCALARPRSRPMFSTTSPMPKPSGQRPTVVETERRPDGNGAALLGS